MKISDLPLHYNCVSILEHNLDRRADKIALYSLEREMTFRQVSQEVNQVGNALKKLGVRIGDYVAILSLDLPEWVTSFFAVLKLGGVAVGMNTKDATGSSSGVSRTGKFCPAMMSRDSMIQPSPSAW